MRAPTSWPHRIGKACIVLLCGAVMGFAQAYGCAIIDGQGSFPDGALAVLPGALASTALACVLLLAIELGYQRWKAKGKAAPSADTPSSRFARVMAAVVPTWSLRRVALTGACLFLLWLPWGIALYPGSMNWDTFYQITSWYPEGHPLYLIPWEATESFIDNALSDHHPVFDTFLYGLAAKGSDYLFDTWNCGVFAFLVIQALGLALALSAAVAFLRRKGASLGLCFGLLLFIALFPPLPIYAFTMLKDTVFCLFLLPWFLMLASFCLDPERSFASKRGIAAFIILTVLLCLAKKTGLYIVVPSLAAALILTRRHWKVMVSAMASALLVMQVIMPCIVFSLFDVAPGGKQEMLGPLFQQTARYVSEHPSDVTDEEAQAIDTVLGMNRIKEQYAPFWMDEVKFGWNWNATGDEMGAYFRTWLAQGLRHPDSYLEAIFAVSARYLCSEGQVLPDVYLADESVGCWDKLSYPEGLTGFRQGMLALYDALLGLPGIGLLFKAALYALWLPMAFFMVALFHDRRLLPLCAVLLMSLTACIIGPVYQTRYMVAFIYLAPLLVGLPFLRQQPSAIAIGSPEEPASANR